MTNKIFTYWVLTGLSFLINFSCTPGPASSENTLQALYSQALKDASEPLPTEISKSLTPLNSSNQDIIRDPQGRIKVVTYTNYKGFTEFVNSSMKLSRQIWVTAAPEVQERCKVYARKNMDMQLRLHQLLGLRPETSYSLFVEMYVHPRDIFRPCHDPEISDCECTLTWPEGAYQSTDSTYKAAYDSLVMKTDGYPFTGLGYTYDWNPDTPETGVSEFVIKKGAVVEVAQVYTTEEYCR